MKNMDGFSVQLKPVGASCNIDCGYCYMEPFRMKNLKIMSLDILETLVRSTLETGQNVCFSWHGGEPTLAGLEFFQKAIELMGFYKKPNQRVSNVVQTNATTITREFAKFFRDNDFYVGVSIDGPKYVHDLNRVYNDKRGSFDNVMRGVELLKQEQVQMSVIITVTKPTLFYCEDVFKFITSQGFKNIKYNPVFDNQEFVYSITNDEWFDYLKQVLYMWIELNDSDCSIREIEEILEWINKKEVNLCSGDESCLQWVSIDPNGDLYPCEYLRASVSYGNIRDISLANIRQTDQYKKLVRMFLDVPDKCKKCDFFLLCRNGCPANRIKNSQISFDGQYVYCEQRKKMFFELKSLLE